MRDVCVAEGTGPFDVTVGEDPVGPSEFVSTAVVVAAERTKVVDVGRVALRPLNAMVEVALA